MSKYNKTEEQWSGFRINNLTVVSKISEYEYTLKRKGSEYHYIADILDVKCDCGRVSQMKSRSLLSNKPFSCRFCCKRKLHETIGEKCGTLVVDSDFHTRNESGRSVIWFYCTCSECHTKSNHKADVFRSGESSCKICRRSGRFIPKNNIHRSFKRYFSTIIYRCKKKHLNIDISVETLELLMRQQSGKCNLSGLPISIQDGTASLDRIDNSLGYIGENLQWVHRVVNYMKVDLPQDEFLTFCETITNHKKTGFSPPSVV